MLALILSPWASHLNEVLAALNKGIHLSEYARLVEDPAPRGEPVLGKRVTETKWNHETSFRLSSAKVDILGLRKALEIEISPPMPSSALSRSSFRAQ